MTSERYETRWENLRLVVEERPEHWQAFVYHVEQCEILYTAERMSMNAAKLAAVDFAMAHFYGAKHNLKPEVVAEMLVWEAAQS